MKVFYFCFFIKNCSLLQFLLYFICVFVYRPFLKEKGEFLIVAMTEKSKTNTVIPLTRGTCTTPKNIKDTGSCELILGPMFSGKTTTLYRKLTTHTDALDKKALYINHSSDVRETANGNDYITTHSSSFAISDNICCVKVPELRLVAENINIEDFDIIGVDEGQFFEDINEVVRDWVLNMHKIVFVASLDGDSELGVSCPGIYINKVLHLISICSPGAVNKYGAFCKLCIDNDSRLVPAGFSKKIGGQKNHQKEIGGSDIYIPVCLYCHQN